MKRLISKYNGLLAATLSFLMVIGGSLQVVQSTLDEPPKQACMKGLEPSWVLGLSPWFKIKCTR